MSTTVTTAETVTPEAQEDLKFPVPLVEEIPSRYKRRENANGINSRFVLRQKGQNVDIHIKAKPVYVLTVIRRPDRKPTVDEVLEISKDLFQGGSHSIRLDVEGPNGPYCSTDKAVFMVSTPDQTEQP